MNLQASSSPPNSNNNGDPKPDLQNPNNGETTDSPDPHPLFEDFESACSTPYVSAPSSPGRCTSGAAAGGFFYSAPASPMHFVLSSNSASSSSSSSANDAVPLGFEFELGPSGSGPTRPMSSADELFLNGKIRPMKLSTHLEKPQSLAPLLDLNDDVEEVVELCFEAVRGRDLRLRDKSLRRRTRSMSPLRCPSSPFENDAKIVCDNVEQKKNDDHEEEEEEEEEEGISINNTPSVSASSSRSSSAGRNSKRWLFLKEFLRSKSEGRSNNKYFWSTMSFSSQAKEKKPMNTTKNDNNNNTNNPSTSSNVNEVSLDAQKAKRSGQSSAKKAVNGVGKKKTYELHYTANRAQAEEMRKKTYLPYRQGLLGCLGFSSKGYGAVNGLARTLNPVSSR